MHTALWCLTAVSLVGAGISAARPKEIGTRDAEYRPATTDSTPRTEQLDEVAASVPIAESGH